MKNIQEILSDCGLSVPEEKAADFDKVFKENCKSLSPRNELAVYNIYRQQIYPIIDYKQGDIQKDTSSN